MKITKKFKFPWQSIKQLLGVTLGAIIVSISINIFIIPNRIADGGVTGLAIILHYLFNWEIGIVVFLLNIPLFIIGFRFVGKRFLLLSFWGVLVLSIGLNQLYGLPPLTDNQLLSAIFGGLVTGIGLGIIFRFQGSLGGTDILAVLLSRMTPFSVGQLLLAIDTVIFICAAIIFEPEMAMFAMIYMYIATKVIDLVQVGLNYSKSVMIVSNEPVKIADDIINKLERGVTFLQAEGGYSKEEKKIVYCVINRTQLTQIKDIIRKHDKEAFVTIGDVSEVVGEGFSNWHGH